MQVSVCKGCCRTTGDFWSIISIARAGHEDYEDLDRFPTHSHISVWLLGATHVNILRLRIDNLRSNSSLRGCSFQFCQSLVPDLMHRTWQRGQEAECPMSSPFQWF